MTDAFAELVLEQLKLIEADLVAAREEGTAMQGEMRADFRDISHCLDRIESGIVDLRLDLLAERVARIERRLRMTS